MSLPISDYPACLLRVSRAGVLMNHVLCLYQLTLGFVSQPEVTKLV